MQLVNRTADLARVRQPAVASGSISSFPQVSSCGGACGPASISHLELRCASLRFAELRFAERRFAELRSVHNDVLHYK